jgi:hypothetical protein
VAPLSYVEFSATVNAAASGTSAGLAFDYTSANDFLYAAVVAGTNQVVLGHVSLGKWYVDATASATITPGRTYSLLVALNEETSSNVTVVLNGNSVLSYTYNYLVHDGSLGLMAKNGAASFSNLLIRGDDPAYSGGGTPQLAASPAPGSAGPVAVLTSAQLAPVVEAAIERWSALPGMSDEAAILRQVPFEIADLPGLMMGQTIADTIVIDPTAAGYGWFIDATPMQDEEFAGMATGQMRRAIDASPAYGKMDLLTVVMHELGHVLGLGDLDNAGHPDDLMDVALAPGIRRLPGGVVPSTGEANSEVPLLPAGTPTVGPVGLANALPAMSVPRSPAANIAVRRAGRPV